MAKERFVEALAEEFERSAVDALAAAKAQGQVNALSIRWPGDAFWARVYNLTWSAGGDESEMSSLRVPPLPTRELKALRKAHPKLRGFFLGSEGQETLGAADEEIEYEPSEYASWVMGLVSQTLADAAARLQKSPTFKGVALEIGEYGGGSSLSLRSHLRDVGALREQHGYQPRSDFLGAFLALFSDDPKKTAAWLKASPGRPARTR